ncbi:MAG: hypothetical protein Kow0080_23070 [Candidatus Promineifilaceae bacterium]
MTKVFDTNLRTQIWQAKMNKNVWNNSTNPQSALITNYWSLLFILTGDWTDEDCA